MKTNYNHIIPLLSLAFAGFASVSPVARGATITLEDFLVDNPQVTTRDGEMAVAHDGSGAMTGTFGDQGFFVLPEVDAFRIMDSDFTGDYNAASITQIKFELFAQNVIPSFMTFRLIDTSANVFEYYLTGFGGMAGSPITYTLDLVYSSGWLGGEAGFLSALSNVGALEIEIARSGGGAQSYDLNYIQTLGAGGGGGGPSAIPEPNTLALVMAASVTAMMIWRRTRFDRNATTAAD